MCHTGTALVQYRCASQPHLFSADVPNGFSPGGHASAGASPSFTAKPRGAGAALAPVRYSGVDLVCVVFVIGAQA